MCRGCAERVTAEYAEKLGEQPKIEDAASVGRRLGQKDHRVTRRSNAMLVWGMIIAPACGYQPATAPDEQRAFHRHAHQLSPGAATVQSHALGRTLETKQRVELWEEPGAWLPAALIGAAPVRSGATIEKGEWVKLTQVKDYGRPWTGLVWIQVAGDGPSGWIPLRTQAFAILRFRELFRCERSRGPLGRCG